MGDPAILSFEDVSADAAPPCDVRLERVGFRLGPGDLLLARLGEGATRTPLADLADGTFAPTRGRIAYRGREWAALSAEEVSALRATIGRVRDRAEWISNLDLDENVLLARRHHTSLGEREIRAEAAGLAAGFGLEALPDRRVHLVGRRELAAAACVRAFLGGPALLLLERPARGMSGSLMSGLVQAVDAARRRGAAVVWITDDPEIWRSPALTPTLRAETEGGRMVLLAEVGHG